MSLASDQHGCILELTYLCNPQNRQISFFKLTGFPCWHDIGKSLLFILNSEVYNGNYSEVIRRCIKIFSTYLFVQMDDLFV